MNFLPPDSELTDPHGEINDMRVRWDIRFSDSARGSKAVASSWPASVWGLLAAALALSLGAAILGKRKGDEASYAAPNGTSINVTIVDVQPFRP